MINKINLCPVCKEELLPTDKKFMIPVEVPYLNLYVHRVCWNSVRYNLKEFLLRYLQENDVLWYNNNIENKKRKVKRKWN